MSSTLNVDVELDATGLKCPLPVLKVRKAIKGLQKDTLLRVTATDPGSPADMYAFCDSNGHAIEEETTVDGVHIFVIRKG